MKKRILVIDDEVSILKLLNFILSEEYDLVIKQNRMDAMLWLEEGNTPSVIISDLEMPYLDGESLIRNLKISGFYRDIPVVLLSGANDLDALVEKMPFRADIVLKKPFDPRHLKAFIKEVLSPEDVSIS